jgi:DNA-binding PadR family transcriptional regulator
MDIEELAESSLIAFSNEAADGASVYEITDAGRQALREAGRE